MSFVSLIQKSGKFQLLEVAQDGVSYLLIMPGKEALQFVKRYEETGAIKIDSKHVLWKGEGTIPDELNAALDMANLAASGE